MARFLFWILIIPLGLLVISFTISNREKVLINLWPVPLELESPVFAVVLSSIFFGFCIGAFISFVSTSRLHFSKSRLTRKIENFRSEENLLREKVKMLEVELKHIGSKSETRDQKSNKKRQLT